MKNRESSNQPDGKSIIRPRRGHWMTAVALIVVAVAFFSLSAENAEDAGKHETDGSATTRSETTRSPKLKELADPLSKGISVDDKVVKTEDEWRELLTPLQFEVTRRKGTERAFTGEYAENKVPGIYKCVCCGLALFSSETKFDSGTGWPSYDSPISSRHVAEIQDRSWFLQVRTEVLCGRCDAHLGHMFPDGPPETTGLRYCINSAALKFEPKKEAPPEN
ncbi:MAG: peptide-methionine (R)-S-oxide reductase MsrB [Pirellulales bacterium]